MIKAQMDPEFLARQFVEAAQRKAESYGVRLGEGADQGIREFARTGAERILQQPAGAVQDAQTLAAVAAFERLVEEMVSAREEIPGYAISRPGVIGERTLAHALSKLCPIFPIC